MNIKIHDCLDHGAGTCRNEELIEELVATCEAAHKWLDALPIIRDNRRVQQLRDAIAKATTGGTL